MQRRQLTYCVLLFSYGSGPVYNHPEIILKAAETIFLTVLDTNDIAAYK